MSPKLALVPVLAPLALVGCAPSEPLAGPDRGPITATFACEPSAAITVTFTEGIAHLLAEGVDAELLLQPSGSGYSYAGEGHSLRGKGTSATWTDPAGTVRECEEQESTMSPPDDRRSASPLAGTAWRLVAFESSDDAIGRVVPPRVERYTVTFAADGSAAFQLDCNRLNSRWTQTAASDRGGAIEFAPGAMTRAFCGEDAMDTRLAADLAHVRTFTIEGDTLSLSLEADAGSYLWTRRTGL
jgi:heat shock protein HslJ